MTHKSKITPSLFRLHVWRV